MTGGLWLGVQRHGERNVVASQRHHGGLRLLRPLYLDSSGQPCLTVVNPGGGYVGGDRYELGVSVGESSSALVTTQSATKVYRTPGQPVEQKQRFVVEPDAVLEVVPDPLIAYRDADYVQRTRATVARGGRLVMTDIVTPGWAPDGSLYQWKSVLLKTVIGRPTGALIAWDTVHMAHGAYRGESLTNFSVSGDLDPHGFAAERTHLGTLLAVAPELDADAVEEVHDLLVEYEATVPGSRGGVTPLAEPRDSAVAAHPQVRETAGLAVRLMGPGTGPLHELLLDIHAALRRRWGHKTRLNLRKY